ncbi:hypothetical protein L202_06790 [Cryptococcus amylolentus CBS 6039]|uniref:BED-type domain-containing protein n=1 Tax=Cryptococcus amylolentus CBS 6039 TaxID=1295533 RepID=A0A1E3HDF1_9TREE|nr:hypothetical protein L202_06790 [Cryptococcus amylolentus CBS 6039]ODN74379.1 hypothetical protein L202_06790 [Cryptococcus amylolentus CBS 6039]
MSAPSWANQAPRVHPQPHPFHPPPHAIYHPPTQHPPAQWHPAPATRKMHPPPHPSGTPGAPIPLPLPHPSHDFPSLNTVDAFPGQGELEDDLVGIEALDPALYDTPPVTAMEVVPQQARGRSQSVASMSEEGSTTLTFFPNPTQPPIQLKGARKSGLLPAPAGCKLEVNQLLILRPPQASTSQSFDGQTSKWEMYTCRVCSKTYDGKNARSVARRHLQDKHGVPLSLQARRSRWDYAEPKEKNTPELRESILKSKRDWAVKHRQQSKIEKTHAEFLEQFGPRGLSATHGVILIAPRFRGPSGALEAGDSPFIDGINGNIVIPEEILTAVSILRANEKRLKTESATNQPTMPLRASTPPDRLMSALTVSPKSPQRFPQPPQSTHHEIYQHQLDHLRRQHATRPFGFADVPMADRHPGGYGPPTRGVQDVMVGQGQMSMPVYQRAAGERVSGQSVEAVAFASAHPETRAPPQQAPQPQVLEPASEIVSDQGERSRGADSIDIEAEVAAESLLNLSTPIRAPEDEDPPTADPAPRPAPPAWKLLDAPSIGPATKPRPARSKSSLQPFRDPRPEVTRSLSFEQTPSMDDDPFGFGETPDRPTSSATGSSRTRAVTSSRASRKNMPSPSPLSASTRKRKAPPSSPFAPPPPSKTQGQAEPISRPALRPLSTSFSNSNRGFTTLTATPIRSAISSTTPHPLRAAPFSHTKNWLLSSPSNKGDDDGAASLGLVPTHLAPATPGMMRGIIGVETPDHWGVGVGVRGKEGSVGGAGGGAGAGVKVKENGGETGLGTGKVKRKKVVLDTPTR